MAELALFPWSGHVLFDSQQMLGQHALSLGRLTQSLPTVSAKLSCSACRVHLAVTLEEEEEDLVVEEEAVVAVVEATVVAAAMEVVEADEVVEGMTRATVVEEEDMVVEASVEAVAAAATKQLFTTLNFQQSPYMGHCAWVRCLS